MTTATLPAGGTVLLFPGQGSQVRAMGDRVRAHHPDLAAMAEAVVGADPFARAEEGTHFLQPAVYTATIAGWRRARELDGGAEPVAFAGHSLGEIAALVAAGSIDVEDGLRLVTLRGELMRSAAEAQAPGGMVAVLGAATETVTALAEPLGLTVANDNAPSQVVVAGDVGALRKARSALSAMGVKSVPLPIKGAFHSASMATIAPSFERAVRAAKPRPPRAPVFSGLTTHPFDDIPRRLAESLTRGVRWRELVLRLHALGARRFFEVGPNDVLTGLVNRTVVGVEAVALDELDDAWTLTHEKETTCA